LKQPSSLLYFSDIDSISEKYFCQGFFGFFMIGNNIKVLREALNINQSSLAKKIGISQPYLSDIEKEKKTNISNHLLDDIANALSSHTEWLISNNGFSFLPKNPNEFLFFAMKRISEEKEVTVILKNADVAGFSWESLSMSAEIDDTSLLPQVKRIYPFVFKLYSLKYLSSEVIRLRCKETIKTNVAPMNDINFDTMPIDVCIKKAKIIQDNQFFLSLAAEVSKTENILDYILSLGLNDQELHLVDMIRKRKRNIFDVMKFVENI